MNRSGIYNLEEFAVTNELQTFGPGLACNLADRELLSGIEHPGRASSFYMIVLVYPVSFILSRYTSMNMELLYTCMTAVDIVKAVVGFILVKKGVWINNLVSDQKA